VLEPNAPIVGTRAQEAQHTLGFDRQLIVDEDGVRDDGEMRSMFTPDNGHDLASAV
jgi:hypothetical protein